MKYAKGLPEVCYYMEPAVGLVAVKRGEMGYFKVNLSGRNQEYCDQLNRTLKVTDTQLFAMKAGAMFGWHVPGANPKKVDQQVRQSVKVVTKKAPSLPLQVLREVTKRNIRDGKPVYVERPVSTKRKTK